MCRMRQTSPVLVSNSLTGLIQQNSVAGSIQGNLLYYTTGETITEANSNHVKVSIPPPRSVRAMPRKAQEQMGIRRRSSTSQNQKHKNARLDQDYHGAKYLVKHVSQFLQNDKKFMQVVFKLCCKLFNGAYEEQRIPRPLQTQSILQPANVKVLGRMLHGLSLKHLGLQDVESYFSQVQETGSTLGHMSVAESLDFSIGAFFLPPGSCIPLHNHPGMCVVTKFLHGSARIVAFDQAPDEERQSVMDELSNQFPLHDPSSLELAVPITDKVVQAGTVRALFPNTGGNIHLIQADPKMGCVMIDIQAPPYGEEEGEHCVYFSLVTNHYSHPLIGGVRAVLKSDVVPGSFSVQQLKYDGPIVC